MGLTPLSPGGLRVAHPGVQYVEAPRSAEKAKGGNLSPLNLDGSRSTDEHEAKGGEVREGAEGPARVRRVLTWRPLLCLTVET